MAYTSNNMSDIDVNLHQIAIMGNVFYDFTPTAKVSPYVGAGVGFGRSFVEVDNETANDTGLTWQLRAGVNIHTSTGPTWNIGYRYLNYADFDKAEGDYALKFDAKVHALTVGIQFGG
jgi:opacity protein-like surface antigen